MTNVHARTRATLVLVAITCCWRVPLYSQAIESSSEAELHAVLAERRKASLEGDSEKIAASMADEYLQTDILGYVQNKTTWLNEYFNPLAELIKAGTFRWEVFNEKDVQFHSYGDTAVIIGTLEAKGSGARMDPDRHTWVADPNGAFSGKLRFTRVYVKRNGKWLLAALHNAVPLSATPQKSRAAPTERPGGPKVNYAPAKEIDSSIRTAPEKRPGISWIDYADTPKYSATVIRRTAPDKAEVHQGVTDIWYVISGAGTLVTGGSLTEPVQTEPDELRGKGIERGESRHIAKGDIVTIPTGVPHWLSKIDAEIVYLVVKASTK
jgi:mannose-6-phosphate isomerase-like protein (cupin superfamily)